VSDPSANQARPQTPSWDVAFTKISGRVMTRVQECADELVSRLSASGLACELRRHQTPRGLSLFLTVVGQRGLLFILDVTVIDGMAVARKQGAMLDVRLLDADGDVQVSATSPCSSGSGIFYSTSDQVILAAGAVLNVTSLHLLAMGHFDLVQG
jgi:uncharacterized membrane protein (UPF0127 family)